MRIDKPIQMIRLRFIKTKYQEMKMNAFFPWNDRSFRCQFGQTKENTDHKLIHAEEKIIINFLFIPESVSIPIRTKCYDFTLRTFFKPVNIFLNIFLVTPLSSFPGFFLFVLFFLIYSPAASFYYFFFFFWVVQNLLSQRSIIFKISPTHPSFHCSLSLSMSVVRMSFHLINKTN